MDATGATSRSERVGGLELIAHVPQGTRSRAPLLFVHGAFAGAWCWDAHFLPYFAGHGYPAYAVSLRGHGGSDGAATLALASIDDYVADVLLAAQHLGAAPVLIGHSMGGIVVQRVLRRLEVAGAVLMAPVPPQGLAGSAFLLAAQDPELFREIGLIQYAHPAYATLAGLKKAMFSASIGDDEALAYFKRMQQESQRALFDLSWPQYFWIGAAGDLPVKVMGAELDAFFPPYMIRETGRVYGAEPDIIPDMAHAMMLEPHWERAAERMLAWLREQGL